MITVKGQQTEGDLVWPVRVHEVSVPVMVDNVKRYDEFPMTRCIYFVIDVGWGDSILLECDPPGGGLTRYVLIDCHDTSNSRSSYVFVKRFMEKREVDLQPCFPLFESVLLTQGHSDHASGLQVMMRDFGTDWFWYPKSEPNGAVTKLIRCGNRYQQKVHRHQAVDATRELPDFGEARLDVLWPPFADSGSHDRNNENNNSVVLALTLDRVTFVLTGDCEAENWDRILPRLPRTGLKLFKVPHYGARNGTFHGTQTPWLTRLGVTTNLAISSHIRPFRLPEPSVIHAIEGHRMRDVYRTDEHYHLTFETHGSDLRKKWASF